MKGIILVADDDLNIVNMLKRALVFEGYQVVTATNGEAALQLIEQVDPDLLILDIMMPKLNGWEVCITVRKTDQKLPIIMLTAKDEVENRIKGLDLGADDYVVKPFNLEELLARIRAHTRRFRLEQQRSVLLFGDLVLNLEARKAWRNHRLLNLRGKEFDLLAFFMNHPKLVLSKDQIIEQVWSLEYDRESNVIEVYIASLRQKLEENGEQRLIETIRGIGYVLRGD